MPAEVKGQEQPSARSILDRDWVAWDTAQRLGSVIEQSTAPTTDGVDRRKLGQSGKSAALSSVIYLSSPVHVIRWVPDAEQPILFAATCADEPGTDFVATFTLDTQNHCAHQVARCPHPGGVQALVTVGQRFVSGSSSGYIALSEVDGSNLRGIGRLEASGCAALVALDGATSLAAVGDNGSIASIDLSTQQVVLSDEKLDQSLFGCSAAASLHASEVVVAGCAPHLEIIDLRRRPSTMGERLFHPNPNMSFESIAVDPAQPTVVFAGSSAGELAIWDRRMGQMPFARYLLHDGPLWDVRIIPSIAGRLVTAGEDGTVLIWNFGFNPIFGSSHRQGPWNAELSTEDVYRVADSGSFAFNSVDPHPQSGLLAFGSDNGSLTIMETIA